MNPIYVQLTEDLLISSLANGGDREYPLTPKRFYGLGLGAVVQKTCINLSALSTNAQVRLVSEWSLDGVNWNPGQTILANKNTNGDAVGELTTAAEQVPFQRVKAIISAETGSAMETAVISSWQYNRYV